MALRTWGWRKTSMAGQEFSGDALMEALEKGSLTPPVAAGTTLVGMVKQSDKPGCVSFTPAGCDAWVDMPTGMIEKAVHLGERGCDDHSHPLVRITLKQPADAEGQFFAKLLMASQSRSAAERLLPPRGRPLTPARMGRARAAASIGSPILDCDGGCREVLRACIEDTPFSSDLCVFLYGNCYHICTLFGRLLEPILE